MSAQFIPPPCAAAVLAVGTRVENFTILQVLQEGRYGCVYLTRDHVRGVTRVLKEFMPRERALRRPDGAVVARDVGDSMAIAAARRGFIQEADTLAAIQQPGLVRVLSLLNAPHPLCRVMPLYDGVTLERQCRGYSTAPTVRWLAGIVEDLLGALEALHMRGQAHGRVQPDQVLVSELGRATLLGFGSVARELDDDASASPWNALEVHAADRHVPPTLASDLCGLAATAWFAATGEAPPTHRQQRDAGRPWGARERLAVLADSPGDAPYLRGGLIHAIESALATSGRTRPQTVADFRRLLRCEPLTCVAHAEPATPRASDGPLPEAAIEAGWPVDGPAETAKVAAAAYTARPAVEAGTAQAPPRPDLQAPRDMLGAELAARRTGGLASVPPAVPRPDLTASVEPARSEPSWLGATGGAAAVARARKPLRALESARQSQPGLRRAAMWAMGPMVLALAGVALVWWSASPPGISLVNSVGPYARGLFASAAESLAAAATSVVGDGVLPRGAVTRTPVTPTSAVAQPAQAVAAAAPAAEVAPAAARESTAPPAEPSPTEPVERSAPSPLSSPSAGSRASGNLDGDLAPAAVRATKIATPAALCSNRTQFSYVYCMQQQCAKPSQRYRSQCIEFLRDG